ncbi:hypothetical protein [Solwaraspora sp. WMMA2065]|uniref:hypothetical protein n=1 Tax=Solwaraspora sp. WMMA2065 TaxID=3015166 RepID=UPI00259B1420|nr:hypothetical protein [Solwaraspora sp. WMMA2065]WJK33156.1 hypothetical protein O7610_20895 [Solwaraspora sp. WMMA2065]
MTERLGDGIEHALRVVDWTAHGADPARVVSAVRRLRLVESEQDGQDAYHEVLDAIGHNHSGWLYDAVGPAATILAAVTRTTQGWARTTALEVLIDCLAWVRPDQRFTDAAGRTRSVQAALQDAVTSLEPELRTTAAGEDTTTPLSRSAKNLLEALHEFTDDPGRRRATVPQAPSAARA